jgi:hypothetical protein
VAEATPFQSGQIAPPKEFFRSLFSRAENEVIETEEENFNEG